MTTTTTRRTWGELALLFIHSPPRFPPRQHIIRLKHHVRRDAFFAHPLTYANYMKNSLSAIPSGVFVLVWDRSGEHDAKVQGFTRLSCSRASETFFVKRMKVLLLIKSKTANIPGNPIMRSHPSQCTLSYVLHLYRPSSSTRPSELAGKQVERMQRVSNKSWVSEKRKLLSLHDGWRRKHRRKMLASSQCTLAEKVSAVNLFANVRSEALRSSPRR